MGIFDFFNMGLDFATCLVLLVAFLLAIVLALCCHEFAHAFVAYKMGDDTARLSGRMSLNPMKHIDLTGGLCLLFFGFGWAKPVPVNTMRFKNKRAGEICVSLAGIVINIILAIVFIFLDVLISLNLDIYANNFYLLLYYFVYFSAMVNLMLAVFNLLPIFPLDGYNLLVAVFNIQFMGKFDRFMRAYGSFILMAIIIIPILFEFSFLSVAVNWIYYGIAGLFGNIFI